MSETKLYQRAWKRKRYSVGFIIKGKSVFLGPFSSPERAFHEAIKPENRHLVSQSEAFLTVFEVDENDNPTKELGC